MLFRVRDRTKLACRFPEKNKNQKITHANTEQIVSFLQFISNLNQDFHKTLQFDQKIYGENEKFFQFKSIFRF